MNFKALFLTLVTLSYLHAEGIEIVKILNNSQESIFLNTLKIRPHTSKNCIIPVPFSAQQKNFIDIIQDKAYAPTDALEVKTPEGTFYLWHDERGIIVAKKFVLGMDRSEALAQVKLTLSLQEAACVVGLLISVNQSGIITIKKA